MTCLVLKDVATYAPQNPAIHRKHENLIEKDSKHDASV